MADLLLKNGVPVAEALTTSQLCDGATADQHPFAHSNDFR